MSDATPDRVEVGHTRSGVVGNPANTPEPAAVRKYANLMLDHADADLAKSFWRGALWAITRLEGSDEA